MPKFFILSFLLMVSAAGSAQNIEYIELPPPANKVDNSLYNTLKVIDARPDTTSLGIVQTGAFNRKAKVMVKTPLSAQFSHVFNNTITGTANNGELLLHLRQFSYAEITGMTSEKGYCYLRADLYAKKADRYLKINSIDTIIVLKSSIDVTKAILLKGSEMATGFLAANLANKPNDLPGLTYHELLHIDSAEKSKIKLYTTATYADGVYTNYQSFKNQVPDIPVVVEGNMVSDGFVKFKDDKGKLQKVKSKNAYAFVYMGLPYVVTQYDFYPLKKEGDNFLFTGRAKVTANTADVITASVFFGMLGGLIASNADGLFEMKLDHANGDFIRLKEIKDNSGANN